MSPGFKWPSMADLLVMWILCPVRALIFPAWELIKPLKKISSPMSLNVLKKDSSSKPTSLRFLSQESQHVSLPSSSHHLSTRRCEGYSAMPFTTRVMPYTSPIVRTENRHLWGGYPSFCFEPKWSFPSLARHLLRLCVWTGLSVFSHSHAVVLLTLLDLY